MTENSNPETTQRVISDALAEKIARFGENRVLSWISAGEKAYEKRRVSKSSKKSLEKDLEKLAKSIIETMTKDELNEVFRLAHEDYLAKTCTYAPKKLDTIS